MIPNPTNNISSKEAQEIIINRNPLTDSSIIGILEIETGCEWNTEVIIENCIIKHFSCIMVQFNKPVIIRNSCLKKASFNFSYFIGGLTIDNCVVDDYLDFEAGGHNRVGNPIIIKNNRFRGFVNFFDCWFMGEISVNNNKFEKGTNISSNNQLVSFDIPVLMESNSGDLDVESECRKKEV